MAQDDDALIHDPDGGLPRLRAIMARLRDPARGCPWDVAQTFATIAPYTIEEAHEVATRSNAGLGGNCRGNLAICCFNPSFTRKWQRRQGYSHSTM